MPLTRLMIKQSRNIEACDIELSSGFNFFIGENGSGKTSVLEAIYFLGHGRSFRTNLISRMIQKETQELFIYANINNANINNANINNTNTNSSTNQEPQIEHYPQSSIPVGIHRQKDGTGEVKIAGQSNQKIAQLAQILPIQLIHTEGFELLTQGPKFRRSFIDWGVFYGQMTFYTTWTRYKRLMRQRNALLKNVQNYQELKPWDQELAQCATQLDQWRANYIDQFKPIAEQICADFLPQFEVKMDYYRGWDKNTHYQQNLEENFERDQQLGYTFSGPNKADLKLKINGTPVEDVLSRGQLKLMVCALRLAQGQHLSQVIGKSCIYLIDDFASELDSESRQRLTIYLKQAQAQVFISAINENDIAQMQDKNSKQFLLKCGKIEVC